MQCITIAWTCTYQNDFLWANIFDILLFLANKMEHIVFVKEQKKKIMLPVNITTYRTRKNAWVLFRHWRHDLLIVYLVTLSTQINITGAVFCSNFISYMLLCESAVYERVSPPPYVPTLSSFLETHGKWLNSYTVQLLKFFFFIN